MPTLEVRVPLTDQDAAIAQAAVERLTGQPLSESDAAWLRLAPDSRVLHAFMPDGLCPSCLARLRDFLEEALPGRFAQASAQPESRHTAGSPPQTRRPGADR